MNFFIMMPAPMDIIKGMIPNLPEVPADDGKGPFLVIASMVGTISRQLTVPSLDQSRLVQRQLHLFRDRKESQE